MRTHIAWNVPTQRSRAGAPTIRSRRDFHLAGGLVRKGDGENAIRGDAQLSEQVGDAVRQDARLTASGAGKDQNRAIGLPNGGRLHVVEEFGLEEHFIAIRREGSSTACTRASATFAGASAPRAAPASAAAPSHRPRRATRASIRRPYCG